MSTYKRGIDYYGVLGLTKSATDTDIKKAYRRLALEYSPARQKNPELVELFGLVGEAYEVLSHPLRKAIYDQYGEEGMKKGVLTPLGWHPAWLYHGDPLLTFRKFYGTASPYADLLEHLQVPPPVFVDVCEEVKVKGATTEKPLVLELREVYFGALKKIKIRRREFIDDAKTITDVRERIISIEVKPGIPTGTRIAYPEVGDEGPSIIPGDLVFTVELKPHPQFKRMGNDLHLDLKIDLKKSLGGMTLTVNTLDGRVIRFALTDVIVQDYTKTIKGEGLPVYQNPDKKGDLIIKFNVDFPLYLSEEVKAKIAELLEEAMPEEEGPERGQGEEERGESYLVGNNRLVMMDQIGRIEGARMTESPFSLLKMTRALTDRPPNPANTDTNTQQDKKITN